MVESTPIIQSTSDTTHQEHPGDLQTVRRNNDSRWCSNSKSCTLNWLSSIGLTIFLGFILGFAWISFIKNRNNTSRKTLLFLHPRNAITILQALHIIFSLWIYLDFQNVLEIIQWTLMRNHEGVNALKMLCFAPSTEVISLLKCIYHPTLSGSQRGWVLLRYP